MDELNRLAARVWKRVARGEAYEQPRPRPKTPPRQQNSSLFPLLLLLLLTARGN